MQGTAQFCGQSRDRCAIPVTRRPCTRPISTPLRRGFTPILYAGRLERNPATMGDEVTGVCKEQYGASRTPFLSEESCQLEAKALIHLFRQYRRTFCQKFRGKRRCSYLQHTNERVSVDGLNDLYINGRGSAKSKSLDQEKACPQGSNAWLGIRIAFSPDTYISASKFRELYNELTRSMHSVHAIQSLLPKVSALRQYRHA